MDGLKQAQILLVEDNPDDVEITKRALAKSHVANNLHVVRDGQEALDYLHREGEFGNGADVARPDIILLDVNLPKVNGLEVLERVRANEHLSAIPVIMLTASEREADIVRSYQLGSNTYIQKPVEFEKFVNAVNVFNQYWIVIATLPAAQ